MAAVEDGNGNGGWRREIRDGLGHVDHGFTVEYVTAALRSRRSLDERLRFILDLCPRLAVEIAEDRGIDPVLALGPAEGILAEAFQRAQRPEGEQPISSLVGSVSIDVCEARVITPLVRHMVYRGLTTLFSSAGGIGKSRATVQGITEASLGLPVWGCAELAPAGPQKWLYLAGEDAMPMVCSAIKPVLKHYALERTPFDVLCAAELAGGSFTLTAANVRRLVELITAKGYDAIAIDTLVSVLPADVRIIDPVAVRHWCKTTLGVIERETGAAIWLIAHDNAQGSAVSGTADWKNFGRLVLHLERTDGQLRLSSIKDNLGWPFARVELERDPETLMTRVVRAERIAERIARGTGDAEATLSRAMTFAVLPLPQDRRTTRAVEPTLYEAVKGEGITRKRVRDFIDTRVRFEDVKIGRNFCKVAVGLVDGGGAES